MVVALCHTVAFVGVEPRTVEVQVQLANGVPAFTIVGLPDKAVAESKERVRAAQLARFEAMGLSLRTNAEAEGEVLDAIAAPDETGAALLRDAAETLGLTERGYHRVLKVARTLADLQGAEHVSRPHIAEALSYRQGAGVCAAHH